MNESSQEYQDHQQPQTESPQEFTNITRPEDTIGRFVREKTVEEKAAEPPQEKPKLNRRRFMLLTAAAMVGTAAAVKMFGNKPPESQSEELAKPHFETETRASLIGFLNEIRLEPEILPAFLEMQGQPESSYGLFAASSVSFATELEEADSYVYGMGSGSITEYRGELYLTTAFHVIEEAVLNPDLPLAVAIPGIGEIIRCNSRDNLYTFGQLPPVDQNPDVAAFLKLDELTTRKVRRLQELGKLTPLQVHGIVDGPHSEPTTDTLALFRFQYSQVFMDTLNTGTFRKRSEDFDYHTLNAVSQYAVTCGGTSGSPLLRVENDQVLPEIAGVVQFGIFTEEYPKMEDPGKMLGACSQQLEFVPFSTHNLTQKLHRDGDPIR